MGLLNVLVTGATGSIGRVVVDEALQNGHRVRALVRNPATQMLPREVEAMAGDLTRVDTLGRAAEGIDAVVFAHGTYGNLHTAQAVDYGGVRNVLAAFERRKPRVALMTAIAVTDRKGAHDWKRRAERLVRANGPAYTIVRPGWFDYNAPDQLRLVLLQGDRRQSGSPRDGVVARSQVAQVLVKSLTSAVAQQKTFELVAESGPASEEFDRLFATAESDSTGALDAIHDAANMPLDREPPAVVQELAKARARYTA